MLFTQVSAQFDYRGAEYFNHEEEVTLYLEADRESRKSNNKDDYVYRMLKVKVNTESGLAEMLRKELGTGKNAEESFKFGNDYISYTKKYLVIQGHSGFYIFDIRNQRLSQEFKPQNFDILADKDTVRLGEIIVSEDGEYLYGSYTNGSSFFYSVCDIHAPAEIASANNPVFSNSRLFLFPDCEEPENKTAYHLSFYDEELHLTKLFEDKNLHDFPKTKTKYSDEDIEELILSSDLRSKRYIILEEKPGEFIVIDVFVGRIYDLPEERNFSDKKELKDFLVQEQERLKKLDDVDLDSVPPDMD